jgi:NitT/TauT family transport system substrate-binding protein
MDRRCRAIVTLAALLIAVASPGSGAAAEIRIAQLYGLPYLPMHVVVERQLIEARARAAGLDAVTVTPVQLSGGPTANDLLLSGQVDVAMGGATVLMALWERTRASRNPVRGIMAFVDTPVWYITVDPRLRSLADMTDADRLASTGVRVVVQSVVLQMYAARTLGWERRFTFDARTVVMSQPDSVIALLSGKHEVKTHAAIEPFTTIELADPRARVLHTSTDELGGPHVAVVLFTSQRWKTEHAPEYAVLAAAFLEAIDLINAEPRAAAEIYVKREASPLTVDQVAALIGRRDTLHFTPVPNKTLRIARFMHQAGTLKSAPDDWKDLFWETVHDLPGS